MARPRLVPSDSVLEQWYVEEGLTQQQIVQRIWEQDRVRVARSTVAVALHRAGLTDRVRYEDMIPWRVRVEHSSHNLVNILRAAGREARGLELTPAARTQLESFRRRQEEEDCVIAYVPDTAQGWFLVRRRPAPLDRGLIRDLDGRA